jgi:hypothetical protein
MKIFFTAAQFVVSLRLAELVDLLELSSLSLPSLRRRG